MDSTVAESTRRRATRMRLVLAAQEEFGRRGIDATSVEQLCEAAGFTRGAFYSNFATKDDLCVAIAQEVAERTIGACRDALGELPQGSDLGLVVTSILGVASLTENQHRTQLELQLRGWRDPQLGARLAAVREQTLPLAVEVISRAAARAGVDVLADIGDLIRVLEALFFAPSLARDGSSIRLIGLVADALTREETP